MAPLARLRRAVAGGDMPSLSNNDTRRTAPQFHFAPIDAQAPAQHATPGRPGAAADFNRVGYHVTT